MSGSFGSKRGPAGEPGSNGTAGVAGFFEVRQTFVQPAVGAAVNIWWWNNSTRTPPVAGDVVACYAGVYEILDSTGDWREGRLKEIRGGVTEGGSVASGTKFSHAGVTGLQGRPGYLLTDDQFVQPVVGATENIRFVLTYMVPEVGMIIAGAPGKYEVISFLGSNIWECELLEERGTATGNVVPMGVAMAQAV